MENRERDRVSQRTTPTEAGEINRQVEEEKGRQHHSGTTAEFGQNIGESEFPSHDGGNMRNRNPEDMNNSDLGNRGNESSRRSGSGSMGSSSGRSSGSRSSNEMGSDSSRDSIKDVKPDRGSTGELGSTGSSEGRH